MTALLKQAPKRVTLRRRSNQEAMPARSFVGEHGRVLDRAIGETVDQHKETLIELSKV